MSQAYTYSLLTNLLGGLASDKLKMEIELSSIATALERIDTVGTDCIIYFASTLTAPEKTTLDGDTIDPAGGLVGAHDGIPLRSKAQFWESNPGQATTQQTWQSAMSRTTLKLVGGIYLVSWYLEMRVVASGPLNSAGMAQFSIGGNVVGSCYCGVEEWTAYSGWNREVVVDFAEPVLLIEWQRDPTLGGNDSIEIRKMKISVEQIIE